MLKVNKNKTGCIERQILGLFYLLFWQTVIQVYFKYAQSLSPFHVPGFFSSFNLDSPLFNVALCSYVSRGNSFFQVPFCVD